MKKSPYESLISSLWDDNSVLGDFEAQFGDSLMRPEKCRQCGAKLKHTIGDEFQAPERIAKFIPSLSVTCSESCQTAYKLAIEMGAPARIEAFLGKLEPGLRERYKGKK